MKSAAKLQLACPAPARGEDERPAVDCDLDRLRTYHPVTETWAEKREIELIADEEKTMRSIWIAGVAAALALLAAMPLAQSDPQEEWLHGEQCGAEGPVICLE